MDKLHSCAHAFSKLFCINYYCVIGRKGKSKEFTLAFSVYHFHHLAGLQKISDIKATRGNRERVFKNILSGNLTYDMISQSNNFCEMVFRLDYLYRLEEFMDSNTIIFNYDKKKNNSNVEAKYLLQNEIDGNTVYFFIDKDESVAELFGRTFFPKELQDFTTAQAKWTLLYKEKRFLSTNTIEIQYVNPNFHVPNS